MNLFDQISNDIKEAMKARDKVRLEALRNVKKYFLEAKTAPGAADELTDDAALKIIQKLVKQGKDSATLYTEQGRSRIGTGSRHRSLPTQADDRRGTYSCPSEHHRRDRCCGSQGYGSRDGCRHQAVGWPCRRTRHLSQGKGTARLVFIVDKRCKMEIKVDNVR